MINNNIEKLPTIIINLNKHSQRKKLMIEKLKSTLLKNYFFFDAIDGETELHKHNFTAIPNWIDPIDKKKLSVGYIGCTLSHYYVWMYIFNNNIERALVLEDDTVFYEEFDKTLNKILNTNEDYDMLYLSRIPLNELYNLGEEQEVNEDIVLAKYSYNMSSYILTLNGAKKLLNGHCLDYMMPIDEYVPIMYDKDYPFKNYSTYFKDFDKIKTVSLKKNIANQEQRTLFPSAIQESKIY